MYLMYYLNENGERVYTLKVSELLLHFVSHKTPLNHISKGDNKGTCTLVHILKFYSYLIRGSRDIENTEKNCISFTFSANLRSISMATN